MASACLLSIVLYGSPTDADLANISLTPHQLRAAYLLGMANASRRSDLEIKAAVPLLVVVYRELDEVEGITHAESSQMKRHVEARLEQLRGRLIRDNLRRKQELLKAKRRNERQRRSKSIKKNSLELAGATEYENAQELINVIQTTIAPESWDARGGEGSVRYFSLLKVLVIRQTGEVHHQLGGTLNALRK